MRHKGDQSGIESISQLDHVIRLIGLCDLALEQNENQMHLEIQAIKTGNVVRAEEIAKQRAELLAQVQAYAKEHESTLLNGKKTAKLNFGKLGWRKLPDKILVPPRRSPAMDVTVERLCEAQTSDPETFGAIVVLTERYVQATQVKALNDQQLVSIGLKRVPGRDEFFVEPDRAKLVEIDEPTEAVADELQSA